MKHGLTKNLDLELLVTSLGIARREPDFHGRNWETRLLEYDGRADPFVTLMGISMGMAHLARPDSATRHDRHAMGASMLTLCLMGQSLYVAAAQQDVVRLVDMRFGPACELLADDATARIVASLRPGDPLSPDLPVWGRLRADDRDAIEIALAIDPTVAFKSARTDGVRILTEHIEHYRLAGTPDPMIRSLLDRWAHSSVTYGWYAYRAPMPSCRRRAGA